MTETAAIEQSYRFYIGQRVGPIGVIGSNGLAIGHFVTTFGTIGYVVERSTGELMLLRESDLEAK